MSRLPPGVDQLPSRSSTGSGTPIRVLWLSKSLGLGGVERLLAHISKQIDATRFTVQCAYVNPNYADLVPVLEASGIRVICLSTHGGDVFWPVRLLRLVLSGRHDVVHSHSPILASIARCAIRIIPRSRRPAHLTTDHSFWYYYRRVTRFLNAVTAPLDDYSIAVSSDVLGSVSARMRRRTTVQIQGVELAPLWQRRVRSTEVGRTTGGPLQIATVANFTIAKDYPTLFRACRILVDRGLSFRLRIVGGWSSAADKEKTFALCENLGLMPHLEFCGFREDVAALIASCDAFVIASSCDAGPVTAMEAAALGLTIVSTKVGVMIEAFRHEEDCLLVPTRDPLALADAIHRVANDVSLRRRLGERAFQRSGQFDISRVVGALESLYLSHATNPRPPVR